MTILVDGISVIEVSASAETEVEARRIRKEVKTEHNITPFAWIPWGNDNLLPNRIITEVEKDAVIFSSNEFNKQSHYGLGLNYYREIRTKDGIEKDYSGINEVDDWILENDANALFLKFVIDYETVGNRFASFVLNRGRDKVARLQAKDATWCRWGRQNEKTKKVDTLFYQADWNYRNEDFIDMFNVLDVFDPIGHLQAFADKQNSGNEFIYRNKVFTANRFYYELANAEVIMNSGNLEMIDKLKAAYKALLDNSLGVAYHIHVTNEYCLKQCTKAEVSKWNSDPVFRESILKNIKTKVDAWLIGVTNKGKTLISVQYRNDKGELEDGITITTLDDSILQNKSLPVIQQYHAESYNAMGVDPSTIGIANQKDGMNSGSEKKNAFFNQKATQGIDRMYTLMPFVFVSRFNKWTEKYKGFKWEVIDEYPHLQVETKTKPTPDANKK